MKKQHFNLLSLCTILALCSMSCGESGSSDDGVSCKTAADCSNANGGREDYWLCNPESGVCEALIPEHCFNGELDSDVETGVDCGGECISKSKFSDKSKFKCDNKVACKDNTDCKSDACVENVCSEKGCEGDSECPNDGHCVKAADSDNKVCVSCADGIKNQDETDVDCGGSCGACDAKKACGIANDCKSEVCENKVCVSCDDGVKNQDETDVDCGGSCSRCAGDKACHEGKDCQNGVCEGGKCSSVEYKAADPSVLVINEVFDSAKNSPVFSLNGNVTACEFIEIANPSDETVSLMGLKLVLARTDNTEKKVTEIDLSDAGVLAGKSLLVVNNCESLMLPMDAVGLKSELSIVATATYDLYLKNAETEGAKYSLAISRLNKSSFVRNPEFANGSPMVKTIDVAEHAAFATPGYCTNGGHYSEDCATTCNNAVKDNDETDVDCGGSCAIKCGIGLSCKAPEDCASGNCTGGKCEEKSCRTYKDCGDGDRCDTESGKCFTPESCTDGLMNQDEIDVDCGGVCSKCEVGQRCWNSEDCQKGVCKDNICVDVNITEADPNVLVVNEVFDSSKSSPAFKLNGNVNACEFIEIANTSGADISLYGLDLILERTDGDSGTIIEIPLVDAGVLKSHNLLVVHNCDAIDLPSDAIGLKDVIDMKSTGTYNIYIANSKKHGPAYSLSINRVYSSSYVRDPEFVGSSEMKKTTSLSKYAAFATPGYCTNGGKYSEGCVIACENKAKDGDETDVDCGGSCAKCADGKVCKAAGDCVSGYCNDSGKCATKPCETAKDCSRGAVCENGSCVIPPSCTDGIKNQDETDVDCGGSCAAKCNLDESCGVNADCNTNKCDAGKCIERGCKADVDCGKNLKCDLDTRMCYLPPSCKDDIKNQDETDIDCGGSCGACGLTKACKANTDCGSGNCAEGFCAEMGCTRNTDCGGNLVCNRTTKQCVEPAVCMAISDCVGGLTCIKGYCVIPDSCTSNTDCGGGLECSEGLCIPPASCADGIKNQDETDVDCGGSCKACVVGKDCDVANDCHTAVCENGKCAEMKQPVTDPDSLVINEVLDSGARSPALKLNGGVVACEFVEIANATDSAVNLKGLTLVLARTDDNKGTKQEIPLDDAGALAAKSLLVVNNCTSLELPFDAKSLYRYKLSIVSTATYDIYIKNSETNGRVYSLATNKVFNSSYVRDPEFKNTSTMKKTVDISGHVDFATPGYCTNGGLYSKGCVAMCSNSTKDSAESDVDCGGVCSPCANGKKCVGGADCQSGLCSELVCAKDGCAADSDCQPGYVCSINTRSCVKQESCNDGIKNQDETDVDCGGSCGGCSLYSVCNADSDCESTSICYEGTCEIAGCRSDSDCPSGQVCVVDEAHLSSSCVAFESCDDGVRNQDEVDVDCGGSCGVCDVGKACVVNDDCASRMCMNGVCKSTCWYDLECASGLCDSITGQCVAAAETCMDNKKNQDETDTDCGGVCKGCDNGKTCFSNSDCASFRCVVNENTGKATCASNCAVNMTCPSGQICDYYTGQCIVEETCNDNIFNQNETDVDCGGVCPKCGLGKSCFVNDECASGVCGDMYTCVEPEGCANNFDCPDGQICVSSTHECVVVQFGTRISDLRINEVMGSPLTSRYFSTQPNTKQCEFIEIVNLTDRVLSVDNIAIKWAKDENKIIGNPTATIPLSGTIPAKGVLVVSDKDCNIPMPSDGVNIHKNSTWMVNGSRYAVWLSDGYEDGGLVIREPLASPNGRSQNRSEDIGESSILWWHDEVSNNDVTRVNSPGYCSNGYKFSDGCAKPGLAFPRKLWETCLTDEDCEAISFSDDNWGYEFDVPLVCSSGSGYGYCVLECYPDIMMDEYEYDYDDFDYMGVCRAVAGEGFCIEDAEYCSSNYNGIIDGAESDVDCGEMEFNDFTCVDGERCSYDGDCDSYNCVAGDVANFDDSLDKDEYESNSLDGYGVCW